MAKNSSKPNSIAFYFKTEWRALVYILLSGIVYNVGLVAAPWFEGKLAQQLADILNGNAEAIAMARLVGAYIAVTLIVQAARFIKRFYVRRFANNINRRMKGILYANLMRKSRNELESEGAGEIITKAVSDVDDCSKGMRKFTTEVFDTGVALIGYAAMLLFYDWRLALICLVFPPLSYIFAELMKGSVQRAGTAYKKASAALSAATLDRSQNAVTYRIYGCEGAQEQSYEGALSTYEGAAVRANVRQSAMQPLYLVLANLGVIFIVWFGAKNVTGTGWQSWDIAAFTTFLACFIKLSTKSSKAAKLFNTLQQAEVSWRRIKPMLNEPNALDELDVPKSAALSIKNLSFAYEGAEPVFSGLSIDAKPGDIIGVTGPVACGKSTFGRVFLREHPYGGSVNVNGCELSELSEREGAALIGYLGHDPELWNDTIEANVLCGSDADANKYITMTALDDEVRSMEQGIKTIVGSGGVRLSGGQAQRLALARTLAHPRPLIILDDPFSALDRKTEDTVFANLKEYARDKLIILISHRLYHFPEMSKVIFMENGTVKAGTHEELLKSAPAYRSLYESQTGGENHEAK